MPKSGGINATKAKNIHSIAIQVPKTDLTKGGYDASDATDLRSTIGVYASASRQKSRVIGENGEVTYAGPYVQISRLGNPLVNEVVIPVGTKDEWNAAEPAGDKQFSKYVAQPELAKLLPVLYPDVFPNLAKYKKDRADLLAILHTGIPAGIIPGFQNFTGTTQADLLRLNMAIPPTTSEPSNLGLLGADAAGFPNGRRVFDDVTTIELRAIAGATLPLVDKSFTADAAAGAITPGPDVEQHGRERGEHRQLHLLVPLPRPAPQRVREPLLISERSIPMSGTSRRNFLRTASVGAAAVGAASAVPFALAGPADAERVERAGARRTARRLGEERQDRRDRRARRRARGHPPRQEAGPPPRADRRDRAARLTTARPFER